MDRGQAAEERKKRVPLRYRLGKQVCATRCMVESHKMKKRPDRGRTAWLLTRHWVADYPKSEVVAIFNARLGAVRVREFVELIYLTGGSFTLAEQLSMRWPRRRTPYGAKFGQTTEGDPWGCEVFCGDDPYLRARLVDDLIVQRDEDGNETASWRERPRASSSWMHHPRREISE